MHWQVYEEQYFTIGLFAMKTYTKSILQKTGREGRKKVKLKF